MSPLLDLQRQLTEIGRIRLGDEKQSGRMGRKRDTWRLTSRDRVRLEAAQAVYGGELKAWENQWQLLSNATELEIMLIPGQGMTQWWETWGSPGKGSAVSCLRRCDGQREILSDGPCLCPPDYDERRELANNGRACKPTTRLSVLLPVVPGIGCWRLETKGYYAAVELAGAAHILQRATAQGVMLPARLRLDQRESRRNGQVRRFPVPVIEVDAAPAEVLAIAGGTQPPSLALPPASEPVLSEDERRKLFQAARAGGVDEAQLLAIVQRVTGEQSTAAIPKSKLDEILAAVAEAAS